MDELFKREWREYLDATEEISVMFCPMCEKIAEVFFNAGRIHEIKNRLKNPKEALS